MKVGYIVDVAVLFTYSETALLSFNRSRGPFSHLHTQNKQKSETGNERIERKDGVGICQKEEGDWQSCTESGWLTEI